MVADDSEDEDYSWVSCCSLFVRLARLPPSHAALRRQQIDEEYRKIVPQEKKPKRKKSKALAAGGRKSTPKAAGGKVKRGKSTPTISGRYVPRSKHIFLQQQLHRIVILGNSHRVAADGRTTSSSRYVHAPDAASIHAVARAQKRQIETISTKKCVIFGFGFPCHGMILLGRDLSLHSLCHAPNTLRPQQPIDWLTYVTCCCHLRRCSRGWCLRHRLARRRRFSRY